MDAFISYARADVAFVVRLVEGLRNANKRVWVDIEGLVAADEWWQRIKDAITAADHFVFILSPRSASSQVCLDEARLAVSLNKRVIPVLIADLAGPLPQVISGIHWLSFPEGSEDFSNGLEQLIQTMNTDPEWVRDHTRILTHASDWVQDGDPSRLLYGVQLSRASAWLLSYTETRVPAPMSPDGFRILTAAGRRLHVWDLAGNQLSVMDHDSAVDDVQTSPSGRFVTVISHGHAAKLWQMLSPDRIIESFRDSISGLSDEEMKTYLAATKVG